jgi:hypothetical protein
VHGASLGPPLTPAECLPEDETSAFLFIHLLEKFTIKTAHKLHGIYALHLSFTLSPRNGPAEPATMPAIVDTITMFIGQCRRAYAKRLCVLAPRLPSTFLHFPTVISFHSRLLPFCVKGHNVSVEQGADLTRAD